jgi:preprotein translocase subunit Sss1
MTTRTCLHSSQDAQSIKFLQGSLEGFRKGNKAEGFVFFGVVQTSPFHHDHAIYRLMWNLKHRPFTGDCEYGRHAFHDTHGLSSTIREKVAVIDQYLKSITTFNKKIQESRDALVEAKRVAAQSKQPDWKDYLAIAGGALAIASLAHGIFSAIRGAGGGHISRPDVPGHIIVGGGHMELSTHVVVGGGHLNNALNNLKSTADFAKMNNGSLNSELFKKCIAEYPTPAELKDRDARYENERLDQIRRDYYQALYEEKYFGRPVDLEKFKKEIEKLADEIGRQSFDALLNAIEEAAYAGLSIEIPPLAFYEGYKAVQHFKQFGALAEESERLRDLADRWGK